MLAELEQRLSEVIGSRLAGPFAGRTAVSGGSDPPGAGPVVGIRTGRVVPREPDFGSGRRDEPAPGAPSPRRVVRLACDVTLDVRPGPSAGRTQVVAGLDQLLYLLDGPTFRDGSALVGPPDPGFLLESLRLAEGTAAAEAQDAELTLHAVGWFWPPGVAGQAGDPIDHALVRQALLPLRLAPFAPLVAGADPQPLSVRVGPRAALDVEEDATSAAPFGAVALRLVGRGGRPGAGTLAGGTAGPGGERVVPVVDEAVTVTYTPPAEAAVDELVVLAHTVDGDGEQRLGVELARFRLDVLG